MSWRAAAVRRLPFLLLVALLVAPPTLAAGGEAPPSARLLPDAPTGTVLWWAPSSAAKVRPDTLLPLGGPADLEAGTNHHFWIRLHVPREQPAGTYRGSLRLDGEVFRYHRLTTEAGKRRVHGSRSCWKSPRRPRVR